MNSPSIYVLNAFPYYILMAVRGQDNWVSWPFLVTEALARVG